jgi:general nucleoside transport system ATP-binding protein
MATLQNPSAGPGPGQSAAAAATIRMRGISKSYGDTVANAEVDLDLHRGEIHALLGENGAGKTTLMNVLFGLVFPDSGEVWVGDERVALSGPQDALARGIGMVHQHFMLVQRFTVAENVVLGSVSPWNIKLRRHRIEQDVRAAADRFGIALDPRARIRELPVDTQQRVEILKLLYRGARILILDEPTSSLGPAQIAGLFATLRELRDSGHSIVIVTHKLGEVMQIADRVTVLRAGKNALSVEKGDFDERTLARAMTGRDLEGLPPKSQVGDTAPLLRVRELVVHAGARLHAVHGVSFDVQAGEILGVAGVEGNGQRELVDALAGVLKIESGEVVVEGKDLTTGSPRERHRAGISVIPEDRQGWGLVLDMTVAENLALADVPAGKFSQRGLLRPRSIREHAKQLLAEYDVRPPDPDLRVLSLSGGNQQKLVLARELSRGPRVLVAANPTQGLDVGAAAYVQRRLIAVREAGNAVLLVSHDLDELFKLADRIIVLFRGKILYESEIRSVSMDELALAMAGRAPGEGVRADPELVKIAEMEAEG